MEGDKGDPNQVSLLNLEPVPGGSGGLVLSPYVAAKGPGPVVTSDFPGFELDHNFEPGTGLGGAPGVGQGTGSLKYTLVEGPGGDGYLIASSGAAETDFNQLVIDPGDGMGINPGESVSLRVASGDFLTEPILAVDFLDSLQTPADVRGDDTLTLHPAPTSLTDADILVQKSSQLADIDTKLTGLKPPEPLKTAQTVQVPKRKEEIIQKPVGKGPFPCPKCFKEFTLWSALKRHAKLHENDKRLRCPEPDCDETFNVEKNLTLHIATHSSDDNICPECGKKFKRAASFKNHLMIHFEDDMLHCPDCDGEFFNETKLREHLEEAHQQSAVIKDETIDHEAVERGQASIKCGECNKTFATLQSLQVHRGQHRLIKRLTKPKQKRRKTRPQSSYRNKCKYCDKSFKKLSQCERHERIHTGVKPFKCTTCSSAFNQKTSLEIHMRKHTGARPFVCELCNMGFTQQGNLKCHIVKVHSSDAEESTYKCDQCPCSFRKVGTLNAHVSKFHMQLKSTPKNKKTDLLSQAMESTGLKDTEDTALIVLADKVVREGKVVKHLVTVRINKDGAKAYLCNFCDKDFKKPSDLCKHLRLHCLDKPFKCKFCPRSFAVKSAMIGHSRIHQTKDIACKVCDKMFPSVNAMRAHLRLHPTKKKPEQEAKKTTENPKLEEPFVITTTGLVQTVPRYKSVYNPSSKEQLERPFKCTSCPASFKKSSHLKAHQTRHTGMKNFKCETCNNNFVTRSSLNAHLKTHNPSQAFQCSECSLTFTTAGSVRRHMSAHRHERPFVCPYCKKTFKTKVLCTKHIKTHKNNLDDFSVDIPPNQSVLVQETIKQPLTVIDAINPTELVAKIDSDGTVTLTQQNAGFKPSIEELELPVVMQNPQPVSCEDCKSTFNDEKDLQKHKLSCKGRERKNYTVTFSDDIFQCTYEGCSSKFKSAGDLSNHMEATHTSLNDVSISGGKRKPKEVLALRLSPEQEKVLSKTPLKEAKSVSEKLLIKSIKEKNVESVMKTHDEEVLERQAFPHKCEICGKGFKKASDMKRHIRTHTGEKPFACDDCGKRFSVKSTLNVHKRLHTGNVPSIKCHICCSAFSSKVALKTHMRLHTGSKPYVCPHCDERFRTPAQRIAHLLGEHDQDVKKDVKKYPQVPSTSVPVAAPQPIATSSTNTMNPNLVPLNIPAESLISALDVVSKSGDNVIGATVRLQLKGSGLDHSMAQLTVDENLLGQLKSGEDINVVINLNDFNADQTPVMGAQQQSQVIIAEDRENAVRIVQQPPEKTDVIDMSMLNQFFLCPWCDKVYPDENKVSHLLEVHNLEIKDDLSTQQSLAVVNADLKADAPKKAENVDKVCPFCKKQFLKPSQMERHLRIHTGERPFSCGTCRKSFNQKNALQKHLLKHSGERPHTCPFCSYAFTQKGNLKTHIQRTHSLQAQQLVESLPKV